jgi:hypothetical protein
MKSIPNLYSDVLMKNFFFHHPEFFSFSGKITVSYFKEPLMQGRASKEWRRGEVRE